MNDDIEKDTIDDNVIHEDLKEKARSFPAEPGVYLMRDQGGTIIYVGKAKVLRNRVRSYFTGEKDIKTKVMISKVRSLEFIITNSEYEALLLENNLIKKWKPRYNINLKDGKTYPVIRITNEEYPRIFRTRKIIDDGSIYFGPYTDIVKIDRYLELIERLFPLRKCRGDLKKRNSPCLYFHMGRCAAPCCARITHEEYMEHVDRIKRLLSGETEELLGDLERQMRNEVDGLRFEKAAYLRDAIQAIRSLEEQQIVDFNPEARDYVAYASGDGLFSFIVLQMRGGKLLGRDVFRTEGLGTEQEMLEQFLIQYYGTIGKTPSTIFIPVAVETAALKDFFRFELESAVDLALPESGKDAAVIRMAQGNAQEDMVKYREAQGDLPGLVDLKDILALAVLPRRIEGFDIAQLNGKFPVASMVSFLGGRPDRQQYRKFHVKSLGGAIDDFESMREIVARRYTRILNENLEKPDLILIDGGKGQVNAAVSMLELLGLSIPVVGLAKKNEELYLPGRRDPIVLPEGTPALRILQHVRDEAHRFATGFNKHLRKKTIGFTQLESIKGIGQKRSRRLLEEFESLEGILAHTPEEVAERTGMTLEIAERVFENLREETSTGEEGDESV